MKRLQLPQNKLARLAINVAFIPIWYLICGYLFMGIQELLEIEFLSPIFYVLDLLHRLTWLVSIFLVTRYIWFGRVRRSPRITRSKDD